MSLQGDLEFRDANKITFIGGSSNTLIDLTTGSLGVGVTGTSLSSNLHVAGNKIKVGDNIFSTDGPHARLPKEVPLKKYPEIIFESGKFDSNDSTNTYVQAGYTVSASDQNIGSSRYVWKLFDNLDGSDWGTSGGSFDSGQPGVASSTGDEIILADTTTHTRGHWAKIKFPNKIIISTYTLNSTSTDRRPASISILGSNDDTEWYIIKDVHAVGSQDEYSISVNATTAYKYIMFMVHSIIGSDNQMKIGDLKFYGYEEDPPAGDTSVDTTFTSIMNTPQTTGANVYVDAKLSSDFTNQVTGPTPVGTAAVHDNTNKYWELTGALTSNITVEANTFLEGDQPHAVSVWFNSSNLEANTANTCVFSVSDQEHLNSQNLDLQSNTWHNLTYAYQGEGGSRVAYLDGRKVAEDQAEDTFGDYPPFEIGTYSLGGYTVDASYWNMGGTNREAFNIFRATGGGRVTGFHTDNGNYVLNPADANYDTTLMTLTDTSGTAHLGHWVSLELPYKLSPSYCEFEHYGSSYRLKDFVILGSNDDPRIKKTGFTLLFSGQAHVDNNGTNKTSHAFTGSGKFKYLILLTKTLNTGNSTWIINRLQYYGHRENDLVRLPDPTNVLKYPHIAMTGPAQRGYVASASGNTGSGYPWEAFLNDPDSANGFWHGADATEYNVNDNSLANQGTAPSTIVSGSPVHGAWIQLQFPHTIIPTRIDISPRTGQENRAPKAGVLAGSDNGTDWNTIYTFSGASAYTAATYKTFTFTNTTSYKYLRLITTQVGAGGGGNGDKINIGNIEFYGTEEATPVPIQIGGGNIDKVANFRVYDKFVGEDQALEIWDAQKDEFGRAKSSMTLHKGRLGIGTTEPEGRLAVADEPDPTTYGLQEFPPKPLHANETHIEGHGIFRASVSSFHSDTYAGWKAFNKVYVGGEGWMSEDNPDTYTQGTGVPNTTTTRFNGKTGEWLNIDLPYKIHLERTTIIQRTSSDHPRPTGSFTIWGSNDKVNWDEIITGTHTRTVAVNETTGDPINRDIDTSKFYSSYRIQIHSIIVTSGNEDACHVAEWKLFGTREQLPPKQSVLHDGQLTLTKNLTVPSIGPSVTNTRHAVPKRHKLVVEFDTSTNPTGLTTVRDTSEMGNHGTLFGDAFYSAADKAFKFDGTNDVLHVASGTGLPTGDAIYTLSCWIKTDPNQSTTNPSVFYFGSAWTSNQLAGIYLRDGNKLAHDIGSTNSYTTNATITPNKWHHVAVVKRGTGTIVATTTYQGIFVDGVEITELSRNGSDRQQALGTIDNISIGHHFSGTVGSGGAAGVVGFISKPQIWNVALTAEDVKKLYDMGRGDSYHVTNFKNTLVGINLGNGQAPRSALDVRDLIYAESSSVQTFTGQHICFPDESMEKGLIVSAKKNKFVKLNGFATGREAITVDESLPIVSLSNVVQDKACFGVVSKMEESNAAYRTEITGGLVSESVKIVGDNRAIVNSVGEGAIWVVDTNGPLESGDYITTSNVAGYGQKQDSEFLANYSVAKITMDCDFTASNVAVQTIKREETGTRIITEDAWNQLVEYDRYSNVEDEITTYYQIQRGENVLDDNGQLQFEDKTGATEEPYERRFLTTDGTQTDEANAVHIAAFVGCTYHCG